MTVVKGEVIPLHDRVLISDMEFGDEVSTGGIIVKSDNGKAHGVKPRWGKVWAVGPKQQDVKVGEWICIEHGRWTRTFEIEQEDGSILEIRGVDLNAIMLAADEKPAGVQRLA